MVWQQAVNITKLISFIVLDIAKGLQPGGGGTLGRQCDHTLNNYKVLGGLKNILTFLLPLMPKLVRTLYFTEVTGSKFHANLPIRSQYTLTWTKEMVKEKFPLWGRMVDERLEGYRNDQESSYYSGENGKKDKF